MSDAGSRALAALRGRLDARARAHAGACVHCALCADACHVFRADDDVRSIPAAKAERVGRLVRGATTPLGRLASAFGARPTLDDAELAELAEAVFGRCTLCGRCALSCSVGLDPAAVIRLGRVMLHAAGLVPAGIVANTDNALAHGNNMAISREDVLDTLAWLQDDLRDTTGDPTAEIPVDRGGARILYALNPREVKFFPLSIAAAALIFREAGESWTLTSTDFDVTNYGFFGADDDAARRIAGQLYRRAEDLGVEELIVAECGHGFRTLRWEAPEWLGAAPRFRVRSFVELLDEYLAAGRLRLDPSRNAARVTLHDPCNLVRQGGVIDEPRRVLRAAAAQFVEMTPHGPDNFCCGGGGGLLAASEHAARRIASGAPKVAQIRASGASVVACPCHNCIDQLSELNRHHKLGVEIRTLAEIVADALVPADRPPPPGAAGA